MNLNLRAFVNEVIYKSRQCNAFQDLLVELNISGWITDKENQQIKSDYANEGDQLGVSDSKSYCRSPTLSPYRGYTV